VVAICDVEGAVHRGLLLLLLLQEDDDERDVEGLVGKRKPVQRHRGANSKAARATTSDDAERGMFSISVAGTVGCD
jgi:D-Tyr-tRNAtyr deacylase